MCETQTNVLGSEEEEREFRSKVGHVREAKKSVPRGEHIRFVCQRHFTILDCHIFLAKFQKKFKNLIF